MTKTSDPICDLFKAQASRPYSNTGTHLLLTNCKITSSSRMRLKITQTTLYCCNIALSSTLIFIQHQKRTTVVDNYNTIILTTGEIEISVKV